jgi:translation initiation factor 2 subunit 2
LFAEMGTTGSVDGAGRLVIKGRFQQKQVENVLRRYIGMLLFLSYFSSNPGIDGCG